MPEEQTHPFATRMTLLQRAKDPSDAEAWHDFVHYYKPFLLTVVGKRSVSSKDQEDLVQIILLKVWQALPGFHYDQEKAMFRTWLGTIIRNAVIDYFRSEKKHSKNKEFDELCAEFEDTKSKDRVEAMIQQEWERHVIKLALDNIRPKFSEQAMIALEMTLAGKSIEEISAALGMKENSAYKLRNRIKKSLMVEVQRLREEIEAS
ncbi:MAG: sigma-70 family RNA polymerase sigma factor [Planctomycetes bacterium]|nr:sigma-70 family RNA polymerase sigma factor [Planctomycetota bacterium]